MGGDDVQDAIPMPPTHFILMPPTYSNIDEDHEECVGGIGTASCTSSGGLTLLPP